MNYLALVLFCLWVLTELLSGGNAPIPVSEVPEDRITETGEALSSNFSKS